MSVSKHRYRPAFSKEEVEALATILLEAYLTDIAKPLYNPKKPADNTHAFSPEMKLAHAKLIGKTNMLRAKIANNALNPAYIVSKHSDPKITMLENLGAPAEQIAASNGTETKEQGWKRCWIKFIANPQSCTMPEIEAAHEHMYLKGLMTSEEVIAFEAKTGDI